MKRKINKVGSGTMTVSLPRSWVEKVGLKKGDELEVAEEGNALWISNAAVRPGKSIELVLKSDEDVYIRVMLNTAYRSGYDVVNIVYSTAKQLAKIEEVAERFPGFEITEKTATHVVIASVSEVTTDQTDVLVRRTFALLSETNKDLLAFMDGKRQDVDFIIKRSFKIVQYDNLLRRIVNKQLPHLHELRYGFALYQVLIRQEMTHLADVLKTMKMPLSKNALAFFRQYQEYYEDIMKTWYSSNAVGQALLISKVQTLQYKDAYAALESAKGKETIVCHHIDTMLRYSYLLTMMTAGMLTFRKS